MADKIGFGLRSIVFFFIWGLMSLVWGKEELVEEEEKVGRASVVSWLAYVIDEPFSEIERHIDIAFGGRVWRVLVLLLIGCTVVSAIMHLWFFTLVFEAVAIICFTLHRWAGKTCHQLFSPDRWRRRRNFVLLLLLEILVAGGLLRYILQWLQ